MKIWEDERQCYIRAAMEKNSEAENEALKAQLDAIDWSVLEQIERKETVNERGVFAPLYPRPLRGAAPRVRRAAGHPLRELLLRREPL